MATKLFLRSTQANGIGSTYFDMITAAGSGSATAIVNTVASGTEIQWTQTAGGSVQQWISGRAPAGGFTLTSTDISIWAQESNGQANCGGRYRVFKRAANGTETELGGGPFNDGVEFGTSAAEMLWTGNVTDTAFAENDRILLKVYITNVGTMGSGRTCTLTFDAPDGSTGDSFFNIAETVSFKSESTEIATGRADETDTALALSPVVVIATGLATETDTVPTIGRGPELIVNGSGNSLVGWNDNFSGCGTIVNGRIRITNTVLGSSRINQVISGLTPGAIYSLNYDAFLGTGAQVSLFVDNNTEHEAELGFIHGPGIGLSLDIVAPSSPVSGELVIALINNDPDIGDYSEFDNISFRLQGSPAIAIGIGLATETDAALGPFIAPTGRSDEADTALALTAVVITAVGQSSEADTSLQLGLGQSAGRADETNTAIQVGIAFGTGRSDETDTALSTGLSLITGRADEIDTAIALSPGGFTVGRADEVDSAFVLTAILAGPVLAAIETDEAGQLASAMPVAMSVETDTSFFLGLGLNVGRADEVDTALKLTRASTAVAGSSSRFIKDFLA